MPWILTVKIRHVTIHPLRLCSAVSVPTSSLCELLSDLPPYYHPKKSFSVRTYRYSKFTANKEARTFHVGDVLQKNLSSSMPWSLIFTSTHHFMAWAPQTQWRSTANNYHLTSLTVIVCILFLDFFRKIFDVNTAKCQD